MSDNWKKIIDERQAEEERKRKQREDEKRRKQQEIADAELQKLLERHGNKFQCHVCRKRSEQPGETTRDVRVGSVYDDLIIETYTEADWSIPGDLERCSKCHKWTCANDLHQRVCKWCHGF